MPGPRVGRSARSGDAARRVVADSRSEAASGGTAVANQTPRCASKIRFSGFTTALPSDAASLRESAAARGINFDLRLNAKSRKISQLPYAGQSLRC